MKSCATLFSACLALASASASASASVAAAASPADIAGTWVAQQTTPMGPLEFVLRVKSGRDGRLTGFLSGFGDEPIRDGGVVGDSVQLTLETENFRQIGQREVHGTLVGDELQFDASALMPAPPPGALPGGPPGNAVTGGPPAFASQPLVFRRGIPTPSYRPEPIDFRSLPPVELPALKDLPTNGLAQTPPMGWNSWNRFQTRIDDKTVRAIADALVSSGLREAGYVYINIDDGWEGQRDAMGVLHPNPNFPDMKALADYVHAKGLKLGLYSSPGPRTCGGFVGSYGHEALDAATWARWGIDYLKYDWCSASRIWRDEDMRAVYQRMGAALAATGRPILFSLCQYGRAGVEQWGPLVGGNLWRSTGDIQDAWGPMLRNVQEQDHLAAAAGSGHWNDPDMLEIGNGGMMVEEYRTHLSLWAIAAAPLIAGNDLRTMDAATREILLNREVIAVDQDRSGQQGRRVTQQGEVDVWVRPLAGAAAALALVNRSAAPLTTHVSWTALGLPARPQVRDLWRHADLGIVPDGYDASLAPHGVLMLRLTRTESTSSPNSVRQKLIGYLSSVREGKLLTLGT
jgi:alpha-galactosidase